MKTTQDTNKFYHLLQRRSQTFSLMFIAFKLQSNKSLHLIRYQIPRFVFSERTLGSSQRVLFKDTKVIILVTFS